VRNPDQAAFASIPDPRQRRGQRYDLPFLLTCLSEQQGYPPEAPSAISVSSHRVSRRMRGRAVSDSTTPLYHDQIMTIIPPLLIH